MSKINAPHYPIIYVRGYAGTDNEVEDTVSDPYMGFNLGSTKLRTVWTGATERYYFESPLVRLMKDFGYRDVYSSGLDSAAIDTMAPGTMPANSIVIYRYYDLVSSSFGSGKQVRMEDFGTGLGALIEKLRDRICGNDAPSRNDFKVYLVGHSMGGLVIRCFLQNDKISTPATKGLVDKVFTYATPHNGIDLDIIGNVPGFFTHNSADNFNRKRMAQYLGLHGGDDPDMDQSDDAFKEVNTLNGKFDQNRFFCLIGTNPKDYLVASGWSARVVGPFSDGLVRMDNAFVDNPSGDPARPKVLAPRAYVYRSHSGYFGIVNSEEGFQNLTRFLFGNIRVDGALDIRDISLPAALETERMNGKNVRASYQFECIARVRGVHWDLSRRVATENSTIFRTYAELFPRAQKANDAGKSLDRPNHDTPQIFTAFLSSDERFLTQPPSLGFTIDLGVLVPDYEVDGIAWLKDHFPGGYIFRDKLNLEATPPQAQGATWTLRYGFDSDTSNKATTPVPSKQVGGKLEFRISIKKAARPGIDADLILTATNWN